MFALGLHEAWSLGRCVVCGDRLDFEFTTCCDGRECGCHGLPTEPPFCSNLCYDLGLGYLHEPTAASLEANVF